MPVDLKMAWRNIWRHPRRTVLTMSAIAFACLILVFMASFQSGAYETMINSSVKIHTGHVQVQARDYHEKKSMRLVVAAPDEVAAILKEVLGIEAYTFRANAFSLVSSREQTYGAVVVGIDPKREADVSTLESTVRQGDYLSDDDTDGALVGALLAGNLQVGVGDELTILGQGRDGSVAATVVKVKGIYKSGLDEFDRSSVQIALKNFQEVYAMGGAVHEVVAVAESLTSVPAIERAVAAGVGRLDPKYPLTALDWMELVPGLVQAIQLDIIIGLIFYFILILVAAFSIMNTFLMAFLERTREFGVLIAIGTTPRRLTKILLLESVSMTLVGIMAGMVLGSLLTLYFQNRGIDLTGSYEAFTQYGISGTLYPRLSLFTAVIGPAVMMVIAFLVALYPALKVRSLKPVEALIYV